MQAIEAELITEYANGKGRLEHVAKRSAKWYDVTITPILMTLIEQRESILILYVQNNALVPRLPTDAIIETASRNELKARIQLNCGYEHLIVDAILEE